MVIRGSFLPLSLFHLVIMVVLKDYIIMRSILPLSVFHFYLVAILIDYKVVNENLEAFSSLFVVFSLSDILKGCKVIH